MNTLNNFTITIDFNYFSIEKKEFNNKTFLNELKSTFSFTEKNSGKELYYYKEDSTRVYFSILAKDYIIEVAKKYRYFPIEKEITKYVKYENTEIFKDTENKITLKESQLDVNVFIEKGERNSLVSLSTGGGKTILSINYFLKNNLRPVIFCHNNTIIGQWVQKIKAVSNLTDDDIGIVSNNWSLKKMLTKKILIVSSLTYSSQMNTDAGEEKFVTLLDPKKVGVLIVDESHLLLHVVNDIIMTSRIGKNILLTATPSNAIKNINKIIDCILPFKNSFFKISYEQQVDAVFVSFDSKPENKNKTYVKMFSQYNFCKHKYFLYLIKNREEMFLSLLEAVFEDIKANNEGQEENTLIIGTSNKQLDYVKSYLEKRFPGKTINSYYDLSEKKHTKRAPCTGDGFDFTLSSAKAVLAGTDKEDLTSLINLDIFSTESATIQLKGRLTRKHPSKKKAHYYTFVDLGFKEYEKIIAKQYSHILNEGQTTIHTIEHSL